MSCVMSGFRVMEKEGEQVRDVVGVLKIDASPFPRRSKSWELELVQYTFPNSFRLLNHQGAFGE